MESYWGVDHGVEVSKGLPGAGVLRRVGQALRKPKPFNDSAYYSKAPVTGNAKPFDSGHHNPADVAGRARHTKFESPYTTRSGMTGGRERPKTNTERARSGVDPFK